MPDYERRHCNYMADGFCNKCGHVHNKETHMEAQVIYDHTPTPETHHPWIWEDWEEQEQDRPF